MAHRGCEPMRFVMPLAVCRMSRNLPGHTRMCRYESADDKQTGRIWVKYENGHEAPLEPKLNAGFMSSLGYRKCSEADHIRRDVGSHMTEAKKQDEER